MQTLIISFTKKLFFILLLIPGFLLPCSAETSFEEYFQIESGINEKLSDRITTYYSEDISLSLQQQKSELLQLEDQLGSITDNNQNNAVFWFIKGLHHANMAAYYTTSKNPQLAASHISYKNSAYQKTIELDKNASSKLSAAIYSTMKHGLPEDLKIQATKNEIALGGNGDNDSYYWYLHWSHIDQLKQAGRDEEAKEAFKKMKTELKNSGLNMDIYATLDKQIEKSTFNNGNDSVEVTNEKPVSKPAKVTVPEKTARTPEEKKYFILTLLVIFSIVSVVLVTIYELVIKKRKSIPTNQR